MKGRHTKNAIIAFQTYQGMTATGDITQDLVDFMLSGVPYKVFEERYNEAVDFYNDITYVTGAKRMNHIVLDLSTEEYCPNGLAKIYINPNHADKKMIGLINLGCTLDESTSYKDLTVELYTLLYAFDCTLTDLINDVGDHCHP